MHSARYLGRRMADQNVTRKLAAILAADIVGYSRFAGANEEGTIARLKALRQVLIDPSKCCNLSSSVRLNFDLRHAYTSSRILVKKTPGSPLFVWNSIPADSSAPWICQIVSLFARARPVPRSIPI